MPATLTTLRDRVEALLVDSTNVVWATGTLDEAIRQALHEYSRARPQRAISTLTLATAVREQALSSLTGLIGVDRVWFPYTASDPEDPPNWILFDVWENAGAFTLYLKSDDDPAVGDVARVFYRKLQTLNGLDSASATTFAADDESLIVLGSAGYALASEDVDQAGQVRIDPSEESTLSEASNKFLREFRSMLGPLRKPRGPGPRVSI